MVKEDQNSIASTRNDDLFLRISTEEVKAAQFSLNPHNAPGPDGYSPRFYQKIGLSEARMWYI